MGGYEVALQLGHLGLLQPPMLIAVTGRSLSWDRGRAAAAGFSVYLVKPVPPDELVTLLDHCATARAEKP